MCSARASRNLLIDIIVKVPSYLRKACALGSRDNWRIAFRPIDNDPKSSSEAPKKLPYWFQAVGCCKLTELVSIFSQVLSIREFRDVEEIDAECSCVFHDFHFRQP